MTIQLEQAISTLNLLPGQSYTTIVNGYEVEIRVMPVPKSESESVTDQINEDVVPVDPWFEIPDSPPIHTATVARGNAVLPEPIVIDESDLCAE